MCILKNPNIDVKDKEVPEEHFCECEHWVKKYLGFSLGKACNNHPNQNVKADGRVKANPDVWKKNTGSNLTREYTFFACETCVNDPAENGNKLFEWVK